MKTAFRLGSACIALLATGLLSCKPATDEQSVRNVQENETSPVTLPTLPKIEPPLDRSAILLAVENAASAAALGRDDRAAQTRLDGKRIEVRIRFGCPTTSSAVPGAPFQVRFSEDDRTLRLRATPDLTSKDLPALATEEGDNRIDHVEGFWIRRPWLLDAGCPVAPAAVEDSKDLAGRENGEKDAESRAKVERTPSKNSKDAIDPKANEAGSQRSSSTAMSSSPHIGIAQVFTKQDSRLSQRDGRPYEATKALAKDEMPSSSGYDLVLSGRLRAIAGGKVIQCRVVDIESPPVCVVFAHIDSVRMERPDTGSQLAEWSRQ